MEITLESIAFNHDPSMKTTGTFYIRRNETEPVQLPEWEKSRCADGEPDCSPVAYAIHNLPGTVTINASFTAQDPPSDPIWIKAVHVSDDDQPQRPNLLGDTDTQPVSFIGGKGHAIFEICTGTIVQAGACASDHVWSWQISADGIRWSEIRTTSHRVYVVPKIPTCPWEPKSDLSTNIQVPWTEALELACHWAAGVTKDLDLAAEMVTRRVYGLGKVLVKWNQGATYADHNFNLSAFLSLLRNEIGRAQTINCEDCATIVSTFANLLGAELSQSSMGGRGDDFSTYPVQMIGHSQWVSMAFSHHCVAWKGECLEDDELFDACLQIDGDEKPHEAPHFPNQPVRIKFDSGVVNYRSAVFKSGNCVPIPNHRDYGKRRRKFGRGYVADHAIKSKSDFIALKQRYKFHCWPAFKPTRIVRAKLRAEQPDFAYWQSHEPQSLRVDKLASIYQTVLTPLEPLPNQVVDVVAYECDDGIDPNEILLRVLSFFEAFLRRSNHPIGELMFGDGRGSTIVFRRANSVGVVRSVGRESVNVSPLAIVLDRFFIQ